MVEILKAIERTVEAYRTQVIEQRKRVERQKAQVEELERINNNSMAQQSRQLLLKMEEILNQMERELSDAQSRYMARAGENKTPP